MKPVDEDFNYTLGKIPLSQRENHPDIASVPPLGPILPASGKVVYLTENECNFLKECISFVLLVDLEAGSLRTPYEEKCCTDLINKLTVL